MEQSDISTCFSITSSFIYSINVSIDSFLLVDSRVNNQLQFCSLQQIPDRPEEPKSTNNLDTKMILKLQLNMPKGLIFSTKVSTENVR